MVSRQWSSGGHLVKVKLSVLKIDSNTISFFSSIRCVPLDHPIFMAIKHYNYISTKVAHPTRNSITLKTSAERDLYACKNGQIKCIGCYIFLCVFFEIKFLCSFRGRAGALHRAAPPPPPRWRRRRRLARARRPPNKYTLHSRRLPVFPFVPLWRWQGERTDKIRGVCPTSERAAFRCGRSGPGGPILGRT